MLVTIIVAYAMTEDAQLQDLIDELAQQRSKTQDQQGLYERSSTDARRMADLPVVHGLDDLSTLDTLATQPHPHCLRSRAARRPEAPRNPAEECLGIYDCVYGALGVLYPDKKVALLFRNNIEVEPTNASPWDSGAVNRHWEQTHIAPEERRILFARYVLPAPEYRSYFVEYIASCFWQPNDYLYVGRRHAFSDPLGLLDTRKPRLRNFEVRVPREIPVTVDSLLAVFLRQERRPLSHSVAQWLESLESHGVAIDASVSAHAPLQETVCTWLNNWVQRTTAP